MPSMPWRFLVLTEAGSGSGGAEGSKSPAGAAAGRPESKQERPMRIAPQGLDAWLQSLESKLEIPLAKDATGAARSLVLDCRDGNAFGPQAITALLSKAGGSSAPGAAPAQGADLDTVLHHPSFQRLEAAWRGLRFLLDHADQAVEIEVLSSARKDLVTRFRESVFTPETAGNVSSPLSLILADFDFTHGQEDLTALRELAGMARVLQAPLVAAAPPGFFDLRHLAHVTALPDLLERLGDPAHANWRLFQATEEARWIVLTMNRFLLRAPYDLESLGYREKAEEAKPETFLWGRGVWLVGAAVARSVRTHGHGLDLSGRGGHFEGLPVRLYPSAANEKVPLATEVPLPEMKGLELSRAAFTPVDGKLRSDSLVLPIVVTVSRLVPGKLTIEGTLAYQLMAGRLAQFCGLLLEKVPAAPDVAVAYLQGELAGFLGPLAGEKPEEAVTVELIREEREGKTSVSANVQVRPVTPLEGKAIEFGFLLPIPGQ